MVLSSQDGIKSLNKGRPILGDYQVGGRNEQVDRVMFSAFLNSCVKPAAEHEAVLLHRNQADL